MAVSLKHVAEAAGVSVATASLILNGKGERYANDTQSRVLATAKSLGYRPGAAAVATATGRQGAICLLRSPEARDSHLPAALLDGIEQALLARDMHLVVARAATDATEPKYLRQVLADGFLINYQQHIAPEFELMVQQQNLPLMWINVDRSMDCIRPDDEGAGYEATTHALSLGHRRVAAADLSATVNAVSSHYSQPARLAGYHRAMREAGLPPQVLQPTAEESTCSRFDNARQWLSHANRPTAIIAWTQTAMDPCLAAALSLGISIPNQLSVIGIHEHDGHHCGLRPTMMILPWYHIGQLAVQALIERIDGGASLPPIIVPATLTVGSTSGPLSAP